MKQVDNNGFWSIKNNPISKVGVFPYLGKQIDPTLEPDKVYMVLRPAEELFNQETLDSFNENPVPLVDDHTMIGDEYTPPEQKGIDGVVQNIHQEGDRLVGDISIYSKAMKDKISQGKKDLSMGYFCTYDIEDGEYNGEHYDAVQRNIRSNHVALVDRGRCGHDVRVFDRWCFDCIAEDLITFMHHLYEVDFDESPADHNAKIAERQDPIFKDWINTVFQENKIRKFDYNQATGEVKVQIDATNRTKENPHSDVIEITLETSRKTAQDCDFQFIGQRIIEDSEFIESEHPRKKDGKFTKKGSGVAPKAQGSFNFNASKASSTSTGKSTGSVATQKNNAPIQAKNKALQNQKLRYSPEGQKDYDRYRKIIKDRYSDDEKIAVKFFTGKSAPINAVKANAKGRDLEVRMLVKDYNESLKDYGGIKGAIERLDKITSTPMQYDQELYRYATIQEKSCPQLDRVLKRTLPTNDYEQLLEEGDPSKISNKNLQKLVGKEITFPTYLSTSAREDWLHPQEGSHENFWADNTGYPIIFKINAPAGTLGADIKGLGNFSEQDEVLLAPDTTFKINGVSKDVEAGHTRIVFDVDAISSKDIKANEDRLSSNYKDTSRNIKNGYIRAALNSEQKPDDYTEEEYKIIKAAYRMKNGNIEQRGSSFIMEDLCGYDEDMPYKEKDLKSLEDAQKFYEKYNKEYETLQKQYETVKEQTDKDWDNWQKEHPGEANFKLMVRTAGLQNEMIKKEILKNLFEDIISNTKYSIERWKKYQ